MKKIVIEQETNGLLQKKNSFLHRADMRVFTTASNDEALEVHRAVRADLIITRFDTPGMKGDQFCALIREDAGRREVPIIMICANSKGARERGLRSGANAVYRRPIKPALVLAKAQQLLNISLRESYRILLSVVIDGNVNNQAFSCRSLDLSASGMLVETDRAFRKGDRIICSFYLPDAETTQVTTTAEVTRTMPPLPGSKAKRYGVRFTDLSPAAVRAIEAFLEFK
jgi:DNA-binding response OmpR family regulator